MPFARLNPNLSHAIFVCNSIVFNANELHVANCISEMINVTYEWTIWIESVRIRFASYYLFVVLYEMPLLLLPDNAKWTDIFSFNGPPRQETHRRRWSFIHLRSASFSHLIIPCVGLSIQFHLGLSSHMLLRYIFTFTCMYVWKIFEQRLISVVYFSFLFGLWWREKILIMDIIKQCFFAISHIILFAFMSQTPTSSSLMLRPQKKACRTLRCLCGGDRHHQR